MERIFVDGWIGAALVLAGVAICGLLGWLLAQQGNAERGRRRGD